MILISLELIQNIINPLVPELPNITVGIYHYNKYSSKHTSFTVEINSYNKLRDSLYFIEEPHNS